MIDFNYETEFILENEEAIAGWISNVIDVNSVIRYCIANRYISNYP